MNANSSKKVLIVTHTHWDRMWYFTEKAAKILWEYHFKDFLNIYLQNPNLPTFVLDGQSLILEDYFTLHPEDLTDFQKLMKTKKFAIGPSFYQNEQVLVRGESITRNLLYGIETSLKYGRQYEKVMYVPDTFGHSFNLPQIANGFNIKYFVGYRGWSEEKVSPFANFIWQGPNNSKLQASMLPLSYGLGQAMESEAKILRKRFTDSLAKLFTFTNDQIVILPHGNDQTPFPTNLLKAHQQLAKAFPEYHFQEATYYQSVKQIFAALKSPCKYQGELLDGKHSRVHRSYYSTRIDIKSLHHQNEHLLIDILEPLAVMAMQHQFPYYQNHLKKLWKKLLILQGHDSLVGANSDLTNDQVLSKNKLLNNEIIEMINHYQQLLANNLPENKYNQLLVFNFTNNKTSKIHQVKIKTQLTNFIITNDQNQIIDFEIINQKQIPPGEISIKLVADGSKPVFYEYLGLIKDWLPSWGFKNYFIKPRPGKLAIDFKNSLPTEIENRYFKIAANQDGTINIFNHLTKEKYLNNFQIEDGSDVGDNFNYSPLKDDFLITNQNIENIKVNVQETKFLSKLTINYDLLIPLNQEERKNKVCSQKLPITLKIILKTNERTIYLKTTTINNAFDHRLRLVFDSKIASNFSYAGSQYGQAKRFCLDPALKTWDHQQPGLSQWEKWKKIAWSEKPIGIYPFINYVTLKNQKKSFSVINNSSREYEIIGKKYQKIAITLFRSISHCGKSDLLYRPGRLSGIDIASPDSQLFKQKIVHHFALQIDEQNPDLKAQEVLANQQTLFINKLKYHQFPFNQLTSKINKLPFSLFEVHQDFVVESIKKAENDNAIIVKLFAPTNLKLQKPLIKNVKKLTRVTLDEKTILALPTKVEKNEIVVLKVII